VLGNIDIIVPAEALILQIVGSAVLGNISLTSLPPAYLQEQVDEIRARLSKG
jgi:predicted membrane protein